MKQDSFEKILNIWKVTEEKRVQTIIMPKTEQCPSFAQFESGKLTTTQLNHIDDCAYCTRMRRLFSKHQILPNNIVEKKVEKQAVIEKQTFGKKVLKKVGEYFDYGFDILGKIFAPIPTPIKVVFSAAIITVLLIGIFSDAEKNYAKLAQIEPHYYQSINIRDGQSLSESDKLFEQAMLFYEKEKYQKAIDKLLAAKLMRPNDVNINFYLGICYLLIENLDLAIQQFNFVIELESVQFNEMCYWYLGNAYLLKEDGVQAMIMFQKVVGMERDYEWEAKEMIEEIKNRK